VNVQFHSTPFPALTVIRFKLACLLTSLLKIQAQRSTLILEYRENYFFIAVKLKNVTMQGFFFLNTVKIQYYESLCMFLSRAEARVVFRLMSLMM